MLAPLGHAAVVVAGIHGELRGVLVSPLGKFGVRVNGSGGGGFGNPKRRAGVHLEPNQHQPDEGWNQLDSADVPDHELGISTFRYGTAFIS